MRIGVDGWRLQGPQAGVARYILNIVRRWTPDVLPPGVEVVVHVPAPVEADLPENVRVAVHRPNAKMVVWDNARLGPWTRDDIVWYPSHSRPLISRSPTVVTLHDSVWLRHPELYSPQQRRFYNRLYLWSGRHSRAVIVDTAAAKEDLATGTSIPAERIHVVEMAAAERFAPGDHGAEAARILGSDAPFLLFVGKMSGRRNVDVMFEAFADFIASTDRPHRLALVGFSRHREVLSDTLRERGILERTTICGFVSDDELNALYNAADALLMPSVYETVSLPPMEAQATGTAVICVDAAGMRDLTGGAARYIDRMEPALLAEAMRDVAGDADLRARLEREGLENSRRFSWDRTASETLDVLVRAAERP